MDIAALKTKYLNSYEQRDRGLPKSLPEVTRCDDLAYGPDPKWNLLDLYLPKQRQGKVKTVIHIHGGGWICCTKENYQFYGMELAKHGFAFVNFNYHLAPAVTFPKALDDIFLVLHWLNQNAAKYDLDLENVFLAGDSAGGQMAEQVLALLTNENYRKKFGYQCPNFTIKAAALNCGAYFVTRPEVLTGCVPAYFTPEVVAKYGPLLEVERYLTQNLPPLFLMSANEDFLLEQTIRLDGYLLAKDIDHELHIYGTKDEPKRHIFHCDLRDGVAKQCNLAELNFFDRYVK